METTTTPPLAAATGSPSQCCFSLNGKRIGVLRCKSRAVWAGTFNGADTGLAWCNAHGPASRPNPPTPPHGLRLIPLAEEEQDRLEAIFNAGAARVEVLAEHWIRGHDEGLSYCYECCKKKVAELLTAKPDEEYEVDGGWYIEGDSTPWCETCGKRLGNTLTQYGCKENVRHFLDNGFDPKSDDDCYEMERVISAAGWHCHEFESGSNFDRESRRKFFADLFSLGHVILLGLTKENSDFSEPSSFK